MKHETAEFVEFVETMAFEVACGFHFADADALVAHVAFSDGLAFTDEELDEVDHDLLLEVAESMLVN